MPTYINSNNVNYVCTEPERIHAVMDNGFSVIESEHEWVLNFGDKVPDLQAILITAAGRVDDAKDYSVSNGYAIDALR